MNNNIELAEVSWSLLETIGLENYSNIKLGPVTVTLKVPSDQVEEGLQKCVELVEKSLGREREKVLESLASSRKKNN